jgi:hypothetical protein
MKKISQFFRGDWGFILLCLITMFWIFSLRNFVYFRDYSIIFEGAYRVYLGQIPFRDFGSPVGPGSFFIPAIFFKMLGVNWNSMMLAQQFQNCLLLLVLGKLLIQLDVDFNARRISLFFFSFFYLIFLSHPWYNTSALLFMLASVSFAMSNRNIFYILSGVFAGIAILTKQDFGVLSLCIALFVLVFKSTNFFSSAKNLRNDLGLAVKLFMFLSSVVFIVGAFIIFTDFVQFKYWFNYGQSPHLLRSINWTANLYSFLAAFGFFLFGFFMLNFKIMISSAFILSALITSETSGLQFTHYYFIAFIPIIWFETLKIYFHWKLIFTVMISFFLFLLIATPFRDIFFVAPFRDFFYIFESAALKEPEHYFFNYRMNSSSMVPMKKNLNSFSDNIYAPQETIDSIVMVKDLVEKLRVEFKVTSPLVLNMTELTPIYSEIKVEPSIGLPLWFHTNISLFPKEINTLNRQLCENRYDVIMVQGTHEGLTTPYQNFLSILNANDEYKLISQVKNTPAKATSSWPHQDDGDIFIYMKKAYVNF